jgi:hypothetical protein
LEWDRLHVDLQYTPEVLKPTLVKLASSHIPQFLSMITLGVGAMPLMCRPKLKHNEDLALVIKTTQIEYAKALKGT